MLTPTTTNLCHPSVLAGIEKLEKDDGRRDQKRAQAQPRYFFPSTFNVELLADWDPRPVWKPRCMAASEGIIMALRSFKQAQWEAEVLQLIEFNLPPLTTLRCVPTHLLAQQNLTRFSVSVTMSSQWSCKICNVTLQIGARKTHIRGTPHREAIIKTIPEDERWTCDVCPKTTMHINNRGSHLSGGGHQKNLLKRTQPPSRLRSPIGEWKCDICVNRSPMKSKDKDAHVRSSGHQANLLRKESGKGRDPKGSGKDRVHGSQKPSTDDPGISTGGGSSRRYRGGDGGGGSGRGSKSRGRMRGRSDYDDSYMSEDDARALLHDIDTGFGCNPSGGAYSESDFYYGPGDYDYY
ncbi:hypothetical protein VNI00_006220 [Paramarasmius palmivorus]|uniref:U1-type domain-containing protein n=1 Tax=Paramarasmius palmivorus TaxID=297713 RepID=A0AAW0DBG4_9AGAR